MFSNGDPASVDADLGAVVPPTAPQRALWSVHKASAPPTAHTLRGTTWLFSAAADDPFMDHYYHFVEYVVGLWAADALSRSHDHAPGPAVANVVMGPDLARHRWTKASQQGLHDLLLAALSGGDVTVSIASQGDYYKLMAQEVGRSLTCGGRLPGVPQRGRRAFGKGRIVSHSRQAVQNRALPSLLKVVKTSPATASSPATPTTARCRMRAGAPERPP
jgi:hypothetical protein